MRRVPPDRFAKLVDAATEAFIRLGYRRTQMQDVATALGVAKGTLYLYVESKEAVFDAAIRYCDGHAPVPEPTELPLRTPPPGATLTYVQSRIAAETSDLRILRASSDSPPRDTERELEEIARDFYRRAHRNRRAIKLVDRCAADYEQLAAVWFDTGRWAQHALVVDFLDRRIAEGRLRPVPDTSIAARFFIETIAFWAVHRHWDPAPQRLKESEVEDAVLDVLLRGLVA